MSEAPEYERSLAIYVITLLMAINAFLLIVEAAFLSEYVALINSIELILCIPSIIGMWLMEKWGEALALATLCIILGTSMSNVLLAYYLYRTLASYAIVDAVLVVLNVVAIVYLFEAIFQKSVVKASLRSLETCVLQPVDNTAKFRIAVKASLRSLGSGSLELVDDTIKFHLVKGLLKKRTEIAAEIPVTRIESMVRDGNDLTVVWNGITDVFVIEQPQFFGQMYERIAGALEGQRKMLEAEEAAERRVVIAGILSPTIEIVDLLFDVLRNLQGQVDWNRLRGYLKCYDGNVRSLASQKKAVVNLDFVGLSSAIEEHLPEETSKETYNLLRSLSEYFGELASKNEFPGQIHPNLHDARTTILAYFALNDIILGITVGDKEIGKESNELVTTLESLSKETGIIINADEIRDILNKLIMEKGKDSIIGESRAVFRQQLKDLIAV